MSRDPRAALEAAQTGVALARRLGRRTYVTILLANAAEAAVRTGDWAWALGELDLAFSEELEPSDRLLLLGATIDLRALRGEPVVELIDEVTRLAGSSTDPSITAIRHLAASSEALGTGQLADSRVALHRTADLSLEYLPTSIARSARAALWGRDVMAARDDLGGLDGSGIHGEAIEADRVTIRAGIAALEGHAPEALSLYREALRDWRDLGLAWDEALCGLDMALLLDPTEPEVRAAAGSAREILVRLEAAPFIARLEAALARSPDPSDRSAARATTHSQASALAPG